PAGAIPARGHLPGLPAALPAHHDDHDVRPAGGAAADAGYRCRVRAAPAAGLYDGGRPAPVAGADPVHDAGGVSVPGSPASSLCARPGAEAGAAVAARARRGARRLRRAVRGAQSCATEVRPATRWSMKNVYSTAMGMLAISAPASNGPQW